MKKSLIYHKMKEAAISVVPITLIVLFLHLTVTPLTNDELSRFMVGVILLISGLGLFLVGADIGLVPFGQKLGSSLTRLRKLPLLLITAFAIGFAITIAEPDVQVLASQVIKFIPGLSKLPLIIMIAFGVAIFLVIGILRIVLALPLKHFLIIFYILLFILAAKTNPLFLGVAFDAGGATTGPITVPFILALGIGVAGAARKKPGDDSAFGLVGLASIGPIAAVAFFSFQSRPETNLVTDSLPSFSNTLMDHFLTLAPGIIHEIALALSPLLVLFVLFQLVLLKLPGRQVKKVVLGLLYCFVGLVLFMAGVSGGFTPAGHSLGQALGHYGSSGLLIFIGMIMGAVVVCAEPSVWVLTTQVEELSGGHIKRSLMLAALSVSVAGAVTLGMIRVVTGHSIWWDLLPGYGLALILIKFCPPLFTALAFDSGGVASGPMSTTFVLSLTLGASAALGGNPAIDGFGMVAMIAMAPLITIQLLGIVLKYKIAASTKGKHSG